MKSKNDILSGSILKALLAFFFPILLGTFFQQMYNTVDAIIVGKYVGDEALAAVGGATGTLINLLVNFFVGLSSGATVVLSQYYGARNNEGIQTTVHTAAALALVFGVFLTIVGVLLSPTMLVWMGLHEDIMVHAVPYIRIYFLGMIPSLIYNVGAGLLRAVGDSRRPMLFLLVACMVNIVMDIVFTVGLNLGVRGAAIATVLSQIVSATLVAVTFIRSETSYTLKLRKIRFHKKALLQILRIGFPAGIQSAMFSLSNVIVQSAVNQFDTFTLAGYTAYGKLDTLHWMISNAFGVSITTFVGQNFGAGKIDRVRKSVRVCLLIYLIFIGISCSFLLLLGKTLLGLFSNQQSVIAIGYQMIVQLVPFFFTYIGVEILNASVRGTGDTLLPTLIMMFGICVIRVLWVFFVLPMNHTIQMLLWIYPISWTITSLLFLVYYFSGGWLKRSKKRFDGNMIQT